MGNIRKSWLLVLFKFSVQEEEKDNAAVKIHEQCKSPPHPVIASTQITTRPGNIAQSNLMPSVPYVHTYRHTYAGNCANTVDIQLGFTVVKRRQLQAGSTVRLAIGI